MSFKALAGFPPIKRFVRGHYYHIENCQKEGSRVRVMVFRSCLRGRKIRGYTFYKLFDSHPDNSQRNRRHQDSDSMPRYIRAYTLEHDCRVKEVKLEDLPLYMGLHTYPAYAQVMSGVLQEELKSKRKRKLVSKIRRSKLDGRKG